jgi:hypothetical protein
MIKEKEQEAPTLVIETNMPIASELLKSDQRKALG